MKNDPDNFFKPAKTGIPPKQQRAIEALLAGRSKTEAAQAAGVSDRTLRHWFQDPTFRAALTRATDQALADAANRFTGTFDQAAATLIQIMNDPNARPHDRLRAAALILGRGLALVDQKELHDRVAALEITMFGDEQI